MTAPLLRADNKESRPVLVVGVTVEGLSADYLELLRDKFGNDGLNRLLNNAVTGVTKGFEKKLEINGVGFRLSGGPKEIEMALGFSHPVKYSAPEGIELKTDKMTITVSGIDKQQVGQVAAEIRALKKPEPYKGKGIKYVDEVILRKAGKAGKK